MSNPSNPTRTDFEKNRPVNPDQTVKDKAATDKAAADKSATKPAI